MLFHITYILHRRNKLEESLLYQQFLVGADEVEGWLNEKTTLISSDEVGDTLAAVQVSAVCLACLFACLPAVNNFWIRFSRAC